MVDKETLKGFAKRADTASDAELCAIEAGLRAYLARLDTGSEAYCSAHKALGIILKEKLVRFEVGLAMQRRRKQAQP